jgi:DNA modification methylase
MRKTCTGERPYLILKANATEIPLRDDSVSLVIATPPDLGVRHRRQKDYCTSDPDVYRTLMAKFLKEATRIVKRRGHILVVSDTSRTKKARGARRIVFQVLQKRIAGGHRTHERIKSEAFRTHYIEVRNFPWWALSVRLYRDLICRYSERGEIVAHVFSGSGNSGIAALKLERKPILIDLHYHRQTKGRLAKLVACI